MEFKLTYKKEIGKLNYKAIQDWFGNRGYEINEGDIKMWGNDNTHIWWMPNNDTIDPYLSGEENSNSVLWCKWRSMHVEVENEIVIHSPDDLNKLPFKCEWNKYE